MNWPFPWPMGSLASESVGLFGSDDAALHDLEGYLLLLLDTAVLPQDGAPVSVPGNLQLDEAFAAIFQDVASDDFHPFPVLHVGIYLVGQQDRDALFSCDAGKIRYLPPQLPVDLVDIFALPQLEAVEHGDGVHDDEAHIVREVGVQFLKHPLLLVEGGRLEQYPMVQQLFVIRRDLLQALDGEAAFGVDVDDFLLFSCYDGARQQAQVGLSAAGRAVGRGERVCLIAAFQNPVQDFAVC